MRSYFPLFALVSLTFVSLALVACGPPCPKHPHTDALAALSAYRAMRRPVGVLRGEARVEQWGRDGRVRGTVRMFLARPESVRFDAMTQFGPAVILTSDGERFALTDLRENRYLTGPTCPSNIARLLGIPMSGRDLMLFLLGDSPRIDAQRSEIVCTGDGTYLATLRGADGGRQELELEIRRWDVDHDAAPDEQRLRLARSELFDASGATVWRATYSDYRVVRDPRSEEGMGVAMPFSVRFEHPEQEADTTVRFLEMDLNVNAPEGAFVQTARPGIPSEEVSCD